MTGADLKRLRRRCGLSLVAFGEALGIGGDKSASTLAREVRRLEKIPLAIPTEIARGAERLSKCVERSIRPTGWPTGSPSIVASPSELEGTHGRPRNDEPGPYRR